MDDDLICKKIYIGIFHSFSDEFDTFFKVQWNVKSFFIFAWYVFVVRHETGGMTDHVSLGTWEDGSDSEFFDW